MSEIDPKKKAKEGPKRSSRRTSGESAGDNKPTEMLNHLHLQKHFSVDVEVFQMPFKEHKKKSTGTNTNYIPLRISLLQPQSL